MSIDELYTIIRIYRDESLKFYRLLFEKFECDNILDIKEMIPKHGFLDEKKEIKYNFHGIGCKINSFYTVDFSFYQFDENIFIFSSLDIESFISNNRDKYSHLKISGDEIKCFLKILVEDDKIFVNKERSEHFVIFSPSSFNPFHYKANNL